MDLKYNLQIESRGIKEMSFRCGSEEPINSSINYKFIAKHHIPTPKASLWIITCQEEFALAKESYMDDYKSPTNDHYFWNVKRTSIGLEVLGKQNSQNEYIGRFELKNNNMHGYPIDYRIDPKQKPDNIALDKLKNKNKITKAEMMKISRGKAL